MTDFPFVDIFDALFSFSIYDEVFRRFIHRCRGHKFFRRSMSIYFIQRCIFAFENCESK